jgi:hypothetical protein
VKTGEGKKEWLKRQGEERSLLNMVFDIKHVLQLQLTIENI